MAVVRWAPGHSWTQLHIWSWASQTQELSSAWFCILPCILLDNFCLCVLTYTQDNLQSRSSPSTAQAPGIQMLSGLTASTPPSHQQECSPEVCDFNGKSGLLYLVCLCLDVYMCTDVYRCVPLYRGHRSALGVVLHLIFRQQ